ncbi:unnamed protein product, partial [Prorocentrum cordatum]
MQLFLPPSHRPLGARRPGVFFLGGSPAQLGTAEASSSASACSPPWWLPAPSGATGAQGGEASCRCRPGGPRRGGLREGGRREGRRTRACPLVQLVLVVAVVVGMA